MNRAAMKTIIYLDETCKETFRWKNADSKNLSKDDFYDYLTMTGTLLEINGKYVYWVGMENIGVPNILRQRLYDKLKDKLDFEALIINGTHTHSGPGFTKTEMMSSRKANEDQLYMGFVNYCVDLMHDLFFALEKELKPFTAEISVVPIEGCYGNRNDLSLPADKDINLVSFKDMDDNLIGLWMEMTTHSTVIFPKNPKITGDMVGNVRRKVSEYFNCPVMPFVGCAGDSSTRLTRQRSDDPALDYAELMRLVTSISEQIFEKASFAPLVIDRFETAVMQLSYAYKKDKEAIKRRLHKLEQEIEEENNPQQKKIKGDSKMALQFSLNGPLEASDTLVGKVYNFGELKFGVFPGELVASLGLQIISHKPHDHHLVLCYTPDDVGYLVEKEEYGKNFESLTSSIPAGLPEVMTEMIQKKLEEFSE